MAGLGLGLRSWWASGWGILWAWRVGGGDCLGIWGELPVAWLRLVGAGELGGTGWPGGCVCGWTCVGKYVHKANGARRKSLAMAARWLGVAWLWGASWLAATAAEGGELVVGRLGWASWVGSGAGGLLRGAGLLIAGIVGAPGGGGAAAGGVWGLA